MSTPSQIQARKGRQQWHRQSAERLISKQSLSEQVSSDVHSSGERKALWRGSFTSLCGFAGVLLYRQYCVGEFHWPNLAPAGACKSEC